MLEKNNPTMLILVGCLILSVLSTPTYGYLDPGSGSMLTSALVGLFATLLFFVKGLYYRGISGVIGFFGLRTTPPAENHQFVFYSEGRQYWNSFKPILDELVRRREPCVYLTSDETDPGLLSASEFLSTKFIGTGSTAYHCLQFLQADICVMTTPGLDVLQIKRSKGVKHYAHIVHSPTDIAVYKTYSFDYYDSIFTSGNHQIQSIRKLEELRGTYPKHLPKTGCLYYDQMKNPCKSLDTIQRKTKPITVLVAPTWGANGLLRKFGTRVLIPLLKKQWKVILRPHPQSFVGEKSMLDALQEELKPFANLQWDDECDGTKSMAVADVMLSDLSGIVFDYAFVFEKPVITVRYDLNRLGLEAADLPWDPWELTVLDTIGRQVAEEEIDNLPDIIEEEARNEKKKKCIRQLRDESVHNFSCSATPIANELISIRNELQKSMRN